ncbi:MAG: preprotein translocase subunit SecE [Agarilytica sp.]
MSAKLEQQAEFRLDGLKWLVVVALILGGAVANSYYSAEFPVLYRVLAMVAVGIVACLIAVNTAKGDSFFELLKAAQVEIRKVVWPSRQEQIQTTMIVVVVVLIAAVILWLLDMGLGAIASLIIG